MSCRCGWDAKDREALLSFKDTIDSDEIRFKEKIKEVLLDNRFIIHVLHNEELEKAEAEPDEYYGVNILPYYMVKPVQTNVKNYLTYDISFQEIPRGTKIIKLGQIIFHILCHADDAIDKETGIARYDLLSALVMDRFNWTNIFGNQVRVVSNRPSTVDMDYISRTIVLEGEFPNSIAKTFSQPDGKTRVVNSDVVVG